MSPRQVLAMVITSAGILGLVGGVLGVPIGIVLFQALTTAMANLVGFDTLFQTQNLFALPALVTIAVGGIAVAIVGALVPARWASRSSIVEILHTE
jgi:putative ABC transport system permease protein